MPNLFDLSVVYSDFWSILRYLPVSLKLAVFAMVLGLFFGFFIAVIRMKNVKILKPLSTFYISIVRGTPIIVQLYVSYFGIPILLKYINYWNGTNIQIATIPPIIYAIVALSLNQAALHAVTIQAALQAVSRGEIEAASAIGMTHAQRMFRIIIPEAVELALPSLGNTLIGLIKGTSLAFSCGIIEMTAQGKILAGGTYRFFEAYVALAIIYWLVTIIIERIIKKILELVRVPDAPKSQLSTEKKLTLVQKVRLLFLRNSSLAGNGYSAEGANV